jgi:alpha-beta hydrolase superfamily lysophospholipase
MVDFKKNIGASRDYEQNPMDLRVKQFGKDEIKLANYRFVPKEPEKRKAVCFYVHGYGSYIASQAHYLGALADENYEIFAIDWRGFGESGGLRGVIENKE